ncbi:hypothetical protein [Nostoc sp. UHCC 0302]|uniref:hypothetical protein n=1 Tax=Nostoc sp. UHCC 0302 TaxID=3134896 RepID=UPI00311CBEEF
MSCNKIHPPANAVPHCQGEPLRPCGFPTCSKWRETTGGSQQPQILTNDLGLLYNNETFSNNP